MESKVKSSTTIDFDRIEQAIIKALRKHPQGIRNTKLNQESKVNGKSINVKTFNKHLKRLVNEGVVDRNEEARARVFYKLHPTEMEDKRRKIREIGIRYFVVERLVSLYEHRKEINEYQAQKKFNEILSRGGLQPIKNLFVTAISHASNPIDFSLDKNEATEYFQENAMEISRVIEKNDETRAFFYPLLKEAFGCL
jgi:Fe2+ or Zn2+ uptake regulation protein